MIAYEGFVTVEKRRNREIVRVTDSVAILPVDLDLKIALLSSQRREPMVRRDNPRGAIVEVPAGRFDVKLGVRALAKKEVWEEVRKRVRKEQVRFLNKGVPLALSPGVLTERTYLVYVPCNLRNCLKNTSRRFGSKKEGEKIRRFAVSFEKLETMVFQDMKTMALAQAFLKEWKRKERTS